MASINNIFIGHDVFLRIYKLLSARYLKCNGMGNELIQIRIQLAMVFYILCILFLFHLSVTNKQYFCLFLFYLDYGVCLSTYTRLEAGIP